MDICENQNIEFAVHDLELGLTETDWNNFQPESDYERR